jgi:hypothetical protein
VNRRKSDEAIEKRTSVIGIVNSFEIVKCITPASETTDLPYTGLVSRFRKVV